MQSVSHSSAISRRSFISRAGILAATPFFFSPRGRASANELLDIAVIGIANQGRYNLNNVASENIVALCDVDDNYIAKTLVDFPKAQKFNDWRKLLDGKGIDAVVVATPDHSHAIATVSALKSGRHVYCEKPLTHTVSECRKVRETAAKMKKATQLGTQIHAGDNYRRVVELVQSGAVGPVKEVHVWASAVYGGKTLPKDTPPVPEGLHYDLWTGPVEARPYSPEYVPFKWRNWWHYGGGSLGDFGCHFMDLPHWALDLRAPVSVETEGPALDPECPPVWMIARYQYPARGAKPPVKLTWYHGGKQPEQLTPEQKEKWKSGVLFIGDKGQLLSDYSRHVLLPEDKYKDFKRPEQTIPKSIGHHKEWIMACKTGSPTTCNFDYSGALTESVLLGNAAFRAGQKLEWDTKKFKVTNTRAADEYIQHHYRKGWKL